MLRQQSMDALKQIAKGIALQFGPNCEVVIHEISDKSAYSSIVAIENGHVTGRKVGDGPSHVVLEQLGHEDDSVRDQFGYLTRTKDGKILKSTSVYIRDETGRVAAILGINYDISMMQMLDSALHAFITARSARAEGARAHHAQRGRPARRSHPAGRRAGWKAGGPDDQGRQGQGHPLSQQHRRAAHHKIRR